MRRPRRPRIRVGVIDDGLPAPADGGAAAGHGGDTVGTTLGRDGIGSSLSSSAAYVAMTSPPPSITCRPRPAGLFW